MNYKTNKNGTVRSVSKHIFNSRSSIQKKRDLEAERLKKQEDRRLKQEEKKREVEEQRRARESEQERKREEKMRAKAEKEEQKRLQKEKQIQEIKAKLSQQTLNIKSGGIVLQGEGVSSEQLEAIKQREAAKKKEKSEAEKEKERRQQEYKQQFRMFAEAFPDLVERSSIKYPIEDSLIPKTPLLHGSENFPQKPEPK